jgi:hypothetical protein
MLASPGLTAKWFRQRPTQPTVAVNCWHYITVSVIEFAPHSLKTFDMNNVTIPFPEYEFPSKKLNFVDAPFLKTFFFRSTFFFHLSEKVRKKYS